MNANEVIANLALESLGHQKGEYQYVTRTIMSITVNRPTTSIRPPSAWR